jgi:hypothetical protein
VDLKKGRQIWEEEETRKIIRCETRLTSVKKCELKIEISVLSAYL